ncbi:hypothetical protein DINM_002103 [Dirofilaria immitis]|nr:hypothetical protein [Dirofilaria immitis]
MSSRERVYISRDDEQAFEVNIIRTDGLLIEMQISKQESVTFESITAGASKEHRHHITYFWNLFDRFHVSRCFTNAANIPRSSEVEKGGRRRGEGGCIASFAPALSLSSLT